MNEVENFKSKWMEAQRRVEILEAMMETNSRELYDEKIDLRNTEIALLNILDDYVLEKSDMENTQKAILNILDDYSYALSTNKELEAFSYSVSHDLRAPLRAVNGYANILNEDYGDKLDQEGKRIIEIICSNSVRMGKLIDELLAFSRIGRKDLQRTEINMNELTANIIAEFNKTTVHKAEIKVGNLHKIKGDRDLIQQVMLNLISNAVKYSSKKEHPLIEISSEQKDNQVIFAVKDNGSGFDMKYSDKLFNVFQRLHKQDEFDGVGVGLAIIRQIITKHEGRVWAVGKVDEGATFYFSLITN